MDNRPIRPGDRKALVPQRQSRALASAANAQIRLAKLSQGGKIIAGAIPAPLKAASRHSVRFGGWALAVCLIVAAASVALLYARLLAGPISLSFIVPSLQRQLNSQLQGYRLRVGDAILRLSNGWGLEFRLAGVSLSSDGGQEIAKAPFAAIGISVSSLPKFSLAASKISLLGPKVLIYNLPGKGLTLTASPNSGDGENDAQLSVPAPAAGPVAPEHSYPGLAPSSDAREPGAAARLPQQTLNAQPSALPFNPAPMLSRLFSTLARRGRASSALERIGIQDAVLYFASEKDVSTWRVADFHVDLDEDGSESALRGELTLQHQDMGWHATFRAVNRPQSKLYSIKASIHDIVPRAIWHSFPSLDVLKLADLPVSGSAQLDISHEGELLGGTGEIKLGSGQFFAPFNEKHPAIIDSGILKVSYDKEKKALSIEPFELRWDDSVLTLRGALTQRGDAAKQAVWSVELDGKGTVLGAPQFGVPATALDALKISASYEAGTDTVTLKEFVIRGADGGGLSLNGQAQAAGAGGPVVANGQVSPMPVSFLKTIWPAFISNGCREWIGSNVPAGNITGGSISVNAPAAALAALDKDGDIPDTAAVMRINFSGLQIYHVKGLPPIIARDSTARIAGRRFAYELIDARIDVPSGRSISFSNGQLIIDDLRPHIPDAEVRFKGGGEAGPVLELLDQPPLGYVKAVGFKPSLVNGQVAASFKIGFPLLKGLKFQHMTLSGKSRVTDLKSNALPGGLTVNGGTINVDVSETAIAANGDIKVGNVPVTLAWQRLFDAPPERQPTLRAASVLNEKARDELGLNINHIVKGDLPVALAVAMQREGPPKLFVEANLTHTDVFLTSIGWRKPPGQKALVNFDLSQRPDNSLVLDNFAMTGEGLNVAGRLQFNDKHRIAAFSFPEFSTNALTKLAVSGELTPQNVLRVQAKGPSYDGRQFFRSLLTAGKIADNQPAPLKDEPGLDLDVEIETVFGYYDTTVKSLSLDAKRRGGKLTYLEAAGRLNGEAPVAVHIEQKPGRPRMLVSDATDAGSALRLAGFYSAMRGGGMNLQVNLDGGGGVDKSGNLGISNFDVAGDQVVGRVVSQAEREQVRYRPDNRGTGQAASGEPLHFDRMQVPFSITSSQFRLHDAAINGPLLGATLRGYVDFGRENLSLSGTYVPLFGLNGALRDVPVLGTLLSGRQGEGIFGITFAVQGKTSNPNVVVNPMSALAPGILRQIFEFENQSGRTP